MCPLPHESGGGRARSEAKADNEVRPRAAPLNKRGVEEEEEFDKEEEAEELYLQSKHASVQAEKKIPLCKPSCSSALIVTQQLCSPTIKIKDSHRWKN